MATETTKKTFKRIAVHVIYESDHVVAGRTARAYERFLTHKDHCSTCKHPQTHTTYLDSGRCYEGHLLYRQAQAAAEPRVLDRVYNG